MSDSIQSQTGECTSVAIFHRLFYVKTPNFATLDIEDIKRFGVPVTGIDSIDREWRDELILRAVPIAQMVEWHRQGVDIYVQDRADCKIIYELIYAHLTAWRDYVQNNINVVKVPMQDLKDMADLASKVYPYAKEQGLFEQVQRDLFLGEYQQVFNDESDLFLKTPRSKQSLAESVEAAKKEAEERMPHVDVMDMFDQRYRRQVF